MYRRDIEGYFHQSQITQISQISQRTQISQINFFSFSFLLNFLLPFLNKQLILPFFSGFFSVFSEYLRSLTFKRLRHNININNNKDK